jgi:hypothetical protein
LAEAVPRSPSSTGFNSRIEASFSCSGLPTPFRRSSERDTLSSWHPSKVGDYVFAPQSDFSSRSAAAPPQRKWRATNVKTKLSLFTKSTSWAALAVALARLSRARRTEQQQLRERHSSHALSLNETELTIMQGCKAWTIRFIRGWSILANSF